MANELQVSYQTGRTVYATIRNATSGFVWDRVSGAFRTYATADVTQYNVALSEQGSASAYYVGNFPNVQAGMYHVTAKNQVGASPAESDGTIAMGDIHWTGSGGITQPMSDLATSGQVGSHLPTRLTRGVAISGFVFKLVSAADHIADFVSGVVSGQISRDGGAFGALQSGAFGEVGLGFYRVNLTSGDLLATTAALRFTATGISGGTSDPRDFSLILQRVSGQ